MLRRLLQLSDRRGILPGQGLARELGVSDSLLSVMLSDLERRGYLEMAHAGIDRYCGSCPRLMTCSVRCLRFWSLTPKAVALLKRGTARVDAARTGH